MSKKKKPYTYKRRPQPRILEILDEKLLRAYDWIHNGKLIAPVEVKRVIGLGIINEGDDPKAYLYFNECIYYDPDYPTVNQYGFFRRQDWD
jgi:hypothetical protein